MPKKDKNTEKEIVDDLENVQEDYLYDERDEIDPESLKDETELDNEEDVPEIEENVPEIEENVPENEEKLDSIETYVVEKGDNIYSIAKKLNIDYKKLYRDNKDLIGNDLNYIKVGMILTINK